MLASSVSSPCAGLMKGLWVYHVRLCNRENHILQFFFYHLIHVFADIHSADNGLIDTLRQGNPMSVGDMLTQIGPGTPMGTLMRQYWMPETGRTAIRRSWRPRARTA